MRALRGGPPGSKNNSPALGRDEWFESEGCGEPGVDGLDKTKVRDEIWRYLSMILQKWNF